MPRRPTTWKWALAAAILLWVLSRVAGCADPLEGALVKTARYGGLDEPEATAPPDGWAWCIAVRRSGAWTLGMRWTGKSKADPRYAAGVQWLAARGRQIYLSQGQALELMHTATVAANRGADPRQIPPGPLAGPGEPILMVGPGLGAPCWQYGRAEWLEPTTRTSTGADGP